MHKYLVYAFLICPFLKAYGDVIIEERVDSWDAPGFLWIVVVFVIIVGIIFVTTFLERKK
jgi:hypothetical protein